MKRTLFSLLLSLSIASVALAFQKTENDSLWKVGIATTSIIPQYDMWLAGYASRTEPSQGKIHDIFAKALAIEDKDGNKAVLVTADLAGLPKAVSDEIRNQLHEKLGLSRSQILLNSSHSHSGPLLNEESIYLYPLEDEDFKKVAQYTEELIVKFVDVVIKAFTEMQPARIYSGNGVARFQVNRRNNTESTMFRQSDLNGPNDPAVPVLKIVNLQEQIIAIAFGYACHPTVLSINNWSGDYPGFAQIELEKDHPGAVAFFFQGAGGDQNPLPRRTVPLARQYGRSLAAAVDRVLEEVMTPLDSKLLTTYDEIQLDFSQLPTKKELESHCEHTTGYQQRWGTHMLKKLAGGQDFLQSYPYPLQVWKLGAQPIFALGGEIVVAYSIRLKEIFGYNSFVLGYSNDVMAYIPSATVLHEGGYEGASSQFAAGMPGTWSYDVESKIIQNLSELAAKIKIYPPANKLIKN